MTWQSIYSSICQRVTLELFFSRRSILIPRLQMIQAEKRVTPLFMPLLICLPAWPGKALDNRDFLDLGGKSMWKGLDLVLKLALAHVQQCLDPHEAASGSLLHAVGFVIQRHLSLM